MAFIKKIKTKVGGDRLREHIHKRLAGYQKGRSRKIIHASSLTKEDVEFCPREEALLDIFNPKPKDEFIGTSLEYTFQYGRWAEAAIQNDWCRDIAFGDWVCPYCGLVYEARMAPYRCTGCGHEGLRYKEMRVQDPSGCSAGVDLLVKLPHKKKLTPVELKTLDKDIFKDLQAPISEHRVRTNLYLNIIERSNAPWKYKVDTSTGLVIYLCKGFGYKDTTVQEWGDAPFSPLKEFEVKKKASTVEVYFDKAEGLTKFRQGNASLPDGICDTLICPRAKKCKMKDKCFSGNYDGKTIEELKVAHGSLPWQ